MLLRRMTLRGNRRASLVACAWTMSCGLLLAVDRSPATAPPEVTADQQTFFEQRIRPLLANNCFACHGPTKQEMGLRLDSRSSIVTGSENGPVVVPGEPEK